MEIENIKNAFKEELLEKIVSVNDIGDLWYLIEIVDGILRKENQMLFENSPDRLVFEFKNRKVEDDRMILKREEQSYRDFEFGKKKKRFRR